LTLELLIRGEYEPIWIYAGDLDGPPRYCHDEKKFKPQKTIFIPVRGWQGSYEREAW
jgi:hypothetical protein